MSLEERIAELTEAIKENSALLTVLTSKARSNIEVPAPKSEAKSEVKSDDSDAAPKRRGRKPKDRVPSASEMKNAAQEYLDSAEDEEEYKSRRAKIKAIVEKFGAAKFTEIAEEHRAEALAMLNGDTEEEEDDDVV